MSVVLTLAALLSAQTFVESPALTGLGCRSVVTGAVTSVVATTVTAPLNTSAQTPKQGEIFFVAVNIASFSQPCSGSLTVRPGFKLPAGLAGC